MGSDEIVNGVFLLLAVLRGGGVSWFHVSRCVGDAGQFVHEERRQRECLGVDLKRRVVVGCKRRKNSQSALNLASVSQDDF